MFNLELAMVAWRQALREAGVNSSDVLDELEGHLHQEIQLRLARGTLEPEAFQQATALLGDVRGLTAEFGKIRKPSSTALWVRGLFGLVAFLALGGFLLRSHDHPSPLLFAHALALTLGDVLVLSAGGLGVCYVVGLRLHRLPPLPQAFSLRRVAVRFTQISTCLVLTGFVLGLLWNVQSQGKCLSGDAREMGTMGTLMWLILFCLVQRFGKVGNHGTMLLCIAGNWIVGLSWFGAGLLAHSAGIGSSWNLNAALILNLGFLAWGSLARGPEATTKETYV